MKAYIKDIYLHNIRLHLQCNYLPVFDLLIEQLKFPVFRRYKEYLEIKIELTVEQEPPPDSRSDIFRLEKKYLSLQSWTKNISVKIGLKSHRICAQLLYPCPLPIETILRLIILEPLRHILKQHNIFLLHSAVLVKDNQGLLICGFPGAGKSTLATLLYNKGYQFLSDEFALIKEGEVFCLPLKIKLDKLSLEALKINSNLTHKFENTQGRPYVFYPKNVTERCRPIITIFLSTRFKYPPSLFLEPLNKKETFVALTHDKINFFADEKNTALRARQVQALADIACKTRGFVLGYRLRHLPKIPQLIDSLF